MLDYDEMVSLVQTRLSTRALHNICAVRVMTFLQEFSSRGKSIIYADFYCYANLSILFGQNFGGKGL